MENNRDKNPSTELKALIIYWSATGNTEKVANAIQRGLDKEKVTTTLSKIPESEVEELYDYDLVFIGSPSYQFLPPKPMLRYVDNKMKHHRERGDIKLCAPKVPGKTAVIFCTYSGPHTGVNEAIPACKYLGQFLEHIGFEVAAEWYIAGEFHGHDELSTKGKLGDIRGRPNERDLSKVENDVRKLIKSMHTASW
jgi:flavorubredoxin